MSNGNQQETFLNDYARTIIRVKAKQLVRRPEFSKSDREDVEQELFLYLLARSSQFDSDRGSVNTFISRVVSTAVAMLVRERRRIKRNGGDGVEVESLEKMAEQSDGTVAPLWATLTRADACRRNGSDPLSDAEEFELVEGVASAMDSLPPELQAICKLLLTQNKAEVKRKLNMSRRSFDAAINEIRDRFTEAGLSKT